MAFGLTLLACILDIFFLMKIALQFTNDKLAVYLSPILVFFIFFRFTIGGNYIQDTMLIPGTISVPFALAGIWLYLKNRFALSFLILGLGTLFQPLVTMQVSMILCTVSIISIKDNLKKLIGAIFAYLIPATFMLGPIMYRQFILEVNYDKQLYYDILYQFRNHLHYIPSLFPKSDYIKFGLLITAGFVSLRLIKLKKLNMLISIITVILIGCLVYWFMLEIVHIETIGKLQWFKTTIWASALACIALAMLITKPLNPIGKLFNWEKVIGWMSFMASLLLLFVITNSNLLPLEKLQGKYYIGNYRKSDLTQLHEWISQNLPENTVVLCSPENTSFSCEAKRNQVIQYQAIIHEPFYMLPWYERFIEVYGVDLRNADRLDMRKQAAELYTIRNYKSDKYHIDYRIDNTKNCNFVNELASPVHQNGDYILTKFIPE